jgi:hypothetical protein
LHQAQRVQQQRILRRDFTLGIAEAGGGFEANLLDRLAQAQIWPFQRN